MLYFMILPLSRLGDCMGSIEISIAFQTNKPLSSYGPLAKQVEAFNFDGVTVYNDMLYQPAWLPLLEIARYTSRIKIGPASVNPFTSHPINIAGNIALIDEYSNGRAYLGLSRGAWLDYVNIKPKRPISSLKEAILCIKHLLRKDTAPFVSDSFSLKGGDSLRWKILRSDIPFLLGSWGPKTITSCIEEISEVKLGGTVNPKVVPWIKGLIKSSVLKKQLDPSNIHLVIGSVCVVDEDGEKARSLARKEVALYLPVIANLDPTLNFDNDLLSSIKNAVDKYNFEEASEFIDDKILDTFAFAGTPEDIIDQMSKLVSAGVDRIELGTPHGFNDDSHGIKLLGTQVLPILKEKQK